MQSSRLPLRQIMDSNANPASNPDTAARRRSGRVVRAPDKFSPEPSQPAVAKRKRDGADDDDDEDDDDEEDEDGENQVPELEDEGSDDGEQDSDANDNDENEAATSRKSRKSLQSKRNKKPSAKKPKINGTQPAAPTRTVTLPRMPKKSVRLETGAKGNGLYGRDTLNGYHQSMAAKSY